MTQHTDATVLVVDDREAYVEAYVTWLGDDYEIRTATDGFEALSELDESVDVVLLDRRMPGFSGDNVLAELRARGFDPRVAMITAVDPDVDIVDMEFDAYLVKPVSAENLRSVVEELLRRASLDDRLTECYALVSKLVALEASNSRKALEATEEYRELKRRLEAAEREASRTLTSLIETDGVAGVYRDIET